MFIMIMGILLTTITVAVYLVSTITFWIESDSEVGCCSWWWSVINGFILYAMILYFIAVAKADDKLIFSKEFQIETTQDDNGSKWQKVDVNGTELNITELLEKLCPEKSKAFVRIYDTEALGYAVEPRYKAKITILDSDGSCIIHKWVSLPSFSGETNE